MLNIKEDLAVEAGKHAYLPMNILNVPLKYEESSTRKLVVFKLIRFYLLNPIRLLEGIKYTTTNIKQGFLVKYTKPIWANIYDFTQFTFWSGFRSTVCENVVHNALLLVIFIVSG